MNKPSSPPNPQAATQSASQDSSKFSEYGDAAKEKLSAAAHTAAESAGSAARECGTHFVAEPAKDLFSLFRDYARDKPDVAAAWCFGLGVLVGWKLRR